MTWLWQVMGISRIYWCNLKKTSSNGAKRQMHLCLSALPVRLSAEILDYFSAIIGPYIAVDVYQHLPDRDLPCAYSRYATCIYIKSALTNIDGFFLPFLWESLHVCFMQEDSPDSKGAFENHVGEALVCKCDSLSGRYFNRLKLCSCYTLPYDRPCNPYALSKYRHPQKKLALFLSSLKNCKLFNFFMRTRKWQRRSKMVFRFTVPNFRSYLMMMVQIFQNF